MYDDRIIALLARKMAGEITQAELKELEVLISRYPDTVYYEEILKNIWVSPVDEADVSDFYHQHKLKYADQLDFKSAEEDIYPVKTKYSGFLIPAFCIGLAVVVVTWFLYKPNNEESFDGNTQIVSGKGIRKNITLPDGTNVWLNAESTLSYDRHMAHNNERVIILSGEAFFDVKHDKAHPFIIKTNKISIKVLGTAFNVKAYESDKETETSLIRGSIELSINNRPAEKIILKPSEKFILNEGLVVNGLNNGKDSRPGATLTIRPIASVVVANKEYIEETSWKDSYLVFKNESMQELVPRLERWFNVKINIRNDKVKDYRFTGAFSNETITEALSAMQLIKPYQFKIKNHDIEIY